MLLNLKRQEFKVGESSKTVTENKEVGCIAKSSKANMCWYIFNHFCDAKENSEKLKIIVKLRS